MHFHQQVYYERRSAQIGLSLKRGGAENVSSELKMYVA
jgi:hypothetical protein